MKKLIAIFFLISFTVTGYAQLKTPLNQEQLDSALVKSKAIIKQGRNFVIFGSIIGITGGYLLYKAIILYKAINSSGEINTAVLEGIARGVLVAGGSVTTLIGVGRVVDGSKRKKEIELELVKFDTNGLASINGIGLKNRF